MYRQLMRDTLRGTNNGATNVDPTAPIPHPGQPTNYQMTPALGGMGPYVNQEVNAFNAPQTIPGTWNGRPIPPSPTSTSVHIPGYGNAPVNYQPGMSDAAFNGTPPPSASGWHPTNTRALMGGLLARYMNESMTPQQWAGMLQGQGQPQPQQQQQQTAFMPAGMYGRQAMQMAGVRGPDSYPNGLLGGGKGGAYRPRGK